MRPLHDSGKGLIACGDDRGSLWLYNLPQFGKDGGKSIEGKVDPTTREGTEYCCYNVNASSFD